MVYIEKYLREASAIIEKIDVDQTRLMVDLVIKLKESKGPDAATSIDTDEL
ncbi:uncharacterized protein METZ01_LOCUS306679, partial [marine metagenome]